MEEMNNSTVNFTTNETSVNSATIFSINSLDICALCINVLLGLPVHSYIIWHIVTGTRIASEFFFLNLSVCEIGNCLKDFCIILFNIHWFSNPSTITNFLLGLAITGRPLFQCLICVKRYLAVVYPVTFLKYKSVRYKVICCTAVWIISLGSCLVCMYFLNLLSYILYKWFYSVQFLLFLSIQLFCCVAVLRALKQSGPGERGREKEEENHMKRKAFYLIIITTVSTVITYLPFTIAGLFSILKQEFSPALFSFGYISFAFAGFVQPVLYLHRVGKLCCFCVALNLRL